MKLIKDIDFDLSFSFIYSARPGTPAADLPDDVSDQTKKDRLQHLQDTISNQALRIARQMLGTEQRILVEGPSKKNPMELRGRTENNRIVNFEAPHHVIGQFVDIKVTDVYANSLRGELVREEKDMGLRIALSPADILANNHHQKAKQNTDANSTNEIGVGTFTP
jgi:tRNA-2-methylthio-N6-dimethylallyladenosine synthase